MDTTVLLANHKESDSHLILHVVHTNAQMLIVSAYDTDVKVLLIQILTM